MKTIHTQGGGVGGEFGAILILAASLLLMVLLAAFLESHLRPPGYTGKGLLALGILYLGSWVAGKHTEWIWQFVLAGAIAAWIHSEMYTDDQDLWIEVALGIHSRAYVYAHVGMICSACIFPPVAIAWGARVYMRSRHPGRGFPVIMDNHRV